MERFTVLISEGMASPTDCMLWLLGPQPWVSGKRGHADTRKEVVASRESHCSQEVSVWAQAWLLAGHVVLLCELEKVPFLVGGCSSYRDPRLMNGWGCISNLLAPQ